MLTKQVLPSRWRFGNNVTEGWRADGNSVVAQKSKSKFDLEAFLAKAVPGGIFAKADSGLTVSKYAKGQAIFAQGDPADAVFYIEKAGSKFRLSLRKVRKQSSHSSKREILSARVV